MSVCGKENGKEVNSKCVMSDRTLISRITILGGIGVIQHVLKQQNYLGEASEFRRLFFASITRLRSERTGLCVGRDCRNQRPKFAYSRGGNEGLGDPVDRSIDQSSNMMARIMLSRENLRIGCGTCHQPCMRITR